MAPPPPPPPPAPGDGVARLGSWQSTTSSTLNYGAPPAGSERLLLVGIEIEHDSGVVDITDVTYGGQSGTELSSWDPGGYLQTELWLFDESDIAAQSGGNITFSSTGIYSASNFTIHAGMYENVDQTTPIAEIVDAEDTVRYFSHENHTKIFPRTRGAIGMKVQSCHPPKSIAQVNRILSDFKAGKRDVAEFWIDLQGMKVHIRYWPVRGSRGEYLGCLETVQDVTSIQSLRGQRRLLDD